MKILFQGDSITDAIRSREQDEYMGSGYATMVAGELGCKYPGECEFVNRGISGNRIVDVYARIKCDIINLKPDVMSLLIGVNDVWHETGDSPNGVDADKFYKVYDMLIDEIKTSLPNIKIMILEPFCLLCDGIKDNWNYFSTEIPKRAEMAKKIAEKHNLKFVPIQQKLDDACKNAPSTYWLRDGVHPTAPGHNLIKSEWLKAFEEMQNE
ncbi:MAG: SGNH/GDSL hydrolase family protein [Clostridia bacterium]|nr:SGNH/GDSL hydrolase family protein [Clostridia bacterium]